MKYKTITRDKNYKDHGSIIKNYKNDRKNPIKLKKANKPKYSVGKANFNSAKRGTNLSKVCVLLA